MSTDYDNFKSWYVDVLTKLFPDREAGFAILMISFPLLERLLRNRAGLLPGRNLVEPFYAELLVLFKELQTTDTAKEFWNIYRNGLLHQVSMSRQKINGDILPIGWLSHDKPGITVDDRGSFWIHPVDFAKKVIDEINADFDSFSRKPDKIPLPNKFRQFASMRESNGKCTSYLGTRTGD
jgi:hypothetical protein